MLKFSQQRAQRRTLRNDILRNCLGVLLFLVALAVALQWVARLTADFPFKAVSVFVCGSSLMFILAMRHLHAASFGPANQVTLVRGSLVALLFGLAADPAAAWIVVILASFTLVLDGLDGWLARRFQVASRFGARFDMETDALLMVALTVLAYTFDKAGLWVLLAGMMRYLFVAASLVLPFLGRSLPPSRRRQTVFVTQAIALIVCVSPIVVQPVSGGIAMFGLLLLTWSFAVDVRYLARVRSELADIKNDA